MTLENGRGKYSKYHPYVFTEQGVAMLSSVLHSDRAIAINIQIMRVFTRIREMVSDRKDILIRLGKLEKKMLESDLHFRKYGEEIQMIFNTLKQLISPPKNLGRK